jgi:hypothetical protein
MARTLTEVLIFLFLSIILFPITLATARPDTFSRNLSPKKTRPQAGETKPPSQASRKNPTAVPIAQAATTNKSSTTFGLVVMINDPLTVKP